MAIILHVDDYAPSHRLIRFILEHGGHTVVTALDGQQALTQLASTSIDLVITDIVMPSMDGLMLTRELRHNTRYKHVPIIFLTASTIDQEDAQISSLDVDVILTKPVDSEEILSEVDRLIARVHDIANPQAGPLLEKRAI